MCCSDDRGHHHHGMSRRRPCFCGCPGSFGGNTRQVNKEQMTAVIRCQLGRLEDEIKTLQEEMESMQNET